MQLYINYLHEAREALHLPLDRLKAPPAAGEPSTAERNAPLDQQLGESIEEVEGLIAGCGGLAQEEGVPNGLATPTVGVTPRRLLMSQVTSTPNNRSMTSSRMLFGAGGETTVGAREEARPSPERLDAQIRSLTYNQVGAFFVFCFLMKS